MPAAYLRRLPHTCDSDIARRCCEGVTSGIHRFPASNPPCFRGRDLRLKTGAQNMRLWFARYVALVVAETPGQFLGQANLGHSWLAFSSRLC